MLSRPRSGLAASLLAAACLLLAAGGAQGGKLFVASDGVDAPGCGSKTSPCRSISSALDAAAAGDTVVVGPGSYGDVDFDGSTDDPGDEHGFPFCGCLVGVVTPGVTILSSHGAAATLIDARALPATRSVLVLAEDVTFGKPGKGFTVTNTSDPVGVGIQLAGARGTARGNQLVATSDSLYVGTGIETLDTAPGPNWIEGNQATGWVAGIRASGPGTTVRRNAVALNYDGIFSLAGNEVAGNVARGNEFGIRSAGADLIGNSVHGNDYGIYVTSGSGRIEQNNLFANAVCGLYNLEITDLLAANNYWGAASGPGAPPADDICNSNSSSIVMPLATKAFKVKAPIKP